ncbi:hypothetical protein ACIRPQ_29275 [Streptomyces sp. NPDC101213]|uniref:hypothetical protein n=1 Tax=Streptomyces sp. NPDC101213 TaxID=3366130 RepID=UPI0037F742CB
MTTEATAAPLDRGAAARLAGQILAGLGAAKKKLDGGRGDVEELAELYDVLSEAADGVRGVIERAGWTRGDTYVPTPWTTETRRVEDLQTDDVFWYEPDLTWLEFRDLWGNTEAAPADELGEDHPDVPAIEEIISHGVGSTVLAVRAVDQDRSNPHEIVCRVLRMEAHDLVSVQVLGVGRG